MAPAAGAQAALVVANTGEAAIELLAQGEEPRTLAAGERLELRPRLLRTAGFSSGGSGPLVVAPKAALVLFARAEGEGGRLALDASALRAQGALYGLPELFVLDGVAGRVSQAETVEVKLAPGAPAAVMVVGRGPSLELDLAIAALFRPRERTAREAG